MYHLVNKFLNLKESLIDFAQPGLDPLVWKKQSDGSWQLDSNAERTILNFLTKFPEVDLNSLAKEIRIVGSLTSNQYLEDTDLDVHIVLKNIEDWNDDKVQYTRKWFSQHQEYVGKHPIEVYVQLNPAQDYLSPGFYNILTKQWEKPPKIVPVGYDPYEDFSDIAQELKNSVKDADLLFGELKRDIIDYETIKQALIKMSDEDKKKFLDRMELKLQEIEKDIDALYLKRKEWVDARRMSTIQMSKDPQQALKDLELAKKWRDANALFKFIARYQYIAVIGELRDIVKDDEEISDDDVNKIKKVLGTENV